MIKKILVSQPKPASERSPYFDIASKFDVELVFRPSIWTIQLSCSPRAMPSTTSSTWLKS